jgi:DNA polymerase-4
MKSRTITLTIKDTNFKVSTRSITIDKYFDSYEEILFYVIDLYEKNFNGKTIRLVGVSLNNLVIGEQYNLFNFDKKITKNKINKNDAIINEINNKFKKEIIFNANKILK